MCVKEDSLTDFEHALYDACEDQFKRMPSSNPWDYARACLEAIEEFKNRRPDGGPPTDDDESVPTQGPTGMCGCDPKFQPDRSNCVMAKFYDSKDCPCRCHHPRWSTDGAEHDVPQGGSGPLPPTGRDETPEASRPGAAPTSDGAQHDAYRWCAECRGTGLRPVGGASGGPEASSTRKDEGLASSGAIKTASSGPPDTEPNE